jgi:hypothetical protein
MRNIIKNKKIDVDEIYVNKKYIVHFFSISAPHL